jgi:hypothetical protein
MDNHIYDHCNCNLLSHHEKASAWELVKLGSFSLPNNVNIFLEND